MSSGSMELHNGENDLATMCDSWKISHDSIAVDIMIASVPGAFQSCVFMMLAQRVSLVSLNYCLGFFVFISDGNDAIKRWL